MSKALMKVLMYAAAILCGGGAAEAVKDHHPSVGVPMFVLGLAAFGLWLTIWQRARSRSQ